MGLHFRKIIFIVVWLMKQMEGSSLEAKHYLKAIMVIKDGRCLYLVEEIQYIIERQA